MVLCVYPLPAHWATIYFFTCQNCQIMSVFAVQEEENFFFRGPSLLIYEALQGAKEMKEAAVCLWLVKNASHLKRGFCWISSYMLSLLWRCLSWVCVLLGTSVPLVCASTIPLLSPLNTLYNDMSVNIHNVFQCEITAPFPHLYILNTFRPIPFYALESTW